MGRYLKNTKIKAGSYAIQMPVGTNSFGPQFPVSGQMRFNSSIDNIEVYYGGAWRGMGLAGRVAIVKDSFFGDGTQTEFVMSQKYAAGHDAEVLAFIGNVFQESQVAYTVGINLLNQGVITFTTAPMPGMPIVVLHNFNSTQVQ